MAYENPDLLEVMSMGRQFGPKELQIFDGAAPEGHRGSYFYDDEGTPATKTQLIKDGILVGRLHSRETAGKLEETPTGNARCLNYHYPPIVRMTNTWIERGKTPVADLFKGIKEGVYARNWLGGMTNGEMFTFSAGEAWMIRDGKLAEPVRDVTLSGNVFKTLADIEAIGDDFYWDESGGCGKAGQGGLPCWLWWAEFTDSRCCCRWRGVNKINPDLKLKYVTEEIDKTNSLWYSLVVFGLLISL
jgi:TldD protein